MASKANKLQAATLKRLRERHSKVTSKVVGKVVLVTFVPAWTTTYGGKQTSGGGKGYKLTWAILETGKCIGYGLGNEKSVKALVSLITQAPEAAKRKAALTPKTTGQRKASKRAASPARTTRARKPAAAAPSAA